ncbi:MAG: non-homologous end-joining DNA ligase [Bryobacteraceae bacterium]
MLATLVDEAFSSEEWIYEPKLDGERCLAFRKGKDLQLLSRNLKPLSGTYPELVPPLLNQAPDSYIVDGEVVAFKNGIANFSQLQRRMQVRDPDEARRRGVEVFYYLFDLLYAGGRDLRDVPLIHRKDLLKQTFEFAGPLRFTQHGERDGEAYFEEACRSGLEGVIAKRCGSAYISKRSRDWLKFKCAAQQEFVIGGYTDTKGERTGFGALLLGYYEGDKLMYAGRVGTGFDTATLRNLDKQLSAIETGKPHFAGELPAVKGVHWVRPELLAQVAFTEWTRDGKLRHPRFMGIRKDKAPRKVVRELPK